MKLSVVNQVLTKKTAFICVVKENNKDEISGVKQVKENSADYLSGLARRRGCGKPQKVAEESVIIHLESSCSKTLKESPEMECKIDTDDKSRTDLLEIIKSQKVHGYWEPTSELLQKIGKNKEELLSKLSGLVKNVKGEFEVVAITLVVLVWIEKYHQDKRSTWIMIHKKGQQWLSAQGIKYAEVAPLITFI